MSKPDEAMKWVRLQAKGRMYSPNPHRTIARHVEVDAGKHDDELSDEAHAYRAGQAASAARIKALEEENAFLSDLVTTYQIRMSDMLTRLEERYPEDFVWLKETDQ